MAVNPVTNRESAPVQDVFGGERKTPHAVFSQSRAESGWTPDSPNGNVAAAHRPNDLAMECPDCAMAGNAGMRLFAREGIGYYCVKGSHVWKDFDALMARNPKKLEFRGITARQEGYKEIKISVPGNVADTFMARFGERGAATLASIMNTLSDSRSMMLTESDLKNIEDKLGKPVANGTMIAGEFYAMKTQLDEQKATVERLRNNLQTAARGSRVQVSDSTVVVELNDDVAEKVRQVVATLGEPWTVESYIAEAARLGAEGGWV